MQVDGYSGARMPFELPPDPSTERRARIARWIGFAFAAVLVALVTYFGYVAFEGSRQLADSPTDSADCRTPATLGWEYEAINYAIETDASLASEPDPLVCGSQGAPAGDAVVGPGGVGLAGWYIPSASGAGPDGPTVILAHGWGSNKSSMLDRARLLHDDFNLVLFDFRNHGQSEPAATTQAVREADDLRAVVDWLETTKGPRAIAVLGVSMGGASAVNAADRDERIDALVLESVHASIANAAQARLDRAGYPLSMPASWAILLGTLMRTGADVSAADPLDAIARLDERPVLIVSGAQDASIGRSDAEDLLRAATEAGVTAELRVCEGAGHGQSNEACPEDYRAWVLGFLQRELAAAG